MIFPTDKEWTDWGISAEAHKFFLLRWQELFDEHTFDAWQVRSSNTLTILNEILDAIDVVRDVHIYHPNIGALIDEAIHTSRNDLVLRKFFPFLSGYLEKLKDSYAKNVKNANKLDLNDFRSLVLVILGNLHSYRERLCTYINDLISKPPDKYKIELYYLIMSLGIELKAAGYSISSLRDSLGILQDSHQPDFQKRFMNLLDSFSGELQNYECRFFINWAADPDINPRDFDIEFLRDKPVGEMTEQEIIFYQQDPKAILASIKIQALDPYSARCNAEEKLESLFAASRLYRRSKSVSIKHPICLISTPNGLKQCVEEDTTRLGYIKDSAKPGQSINALAMLLKRLNIKDSGQLNASLQYLKLSLSASTDESRLVNLWIALESLVLSGDKNIIESISTYVPASDATGYTYRMLRALAIDIKPWWTACDTESIRPNLRKSSKYFLHNYDLLKIFLDKKDGPIITEFLRLAANNPLLIFRIARLWKNIFENPEVFADSLKGHKQNMEWQIRRIYRARNHIIHQGNCLPGTRQLIQHLHTYYIVFINHLVHDLLTNDNWHIADALEHRYFLYNYLQERLRDYAINHLPLKSLLNPARALSGSVDESAWK